MRDLGNREITTPTNRDRGDSSRRSLVRLVAVATLFAAVALAITVTRATPGDVVYVIDVSESIPDETLRDAHALVERVRERASSRVHVVLFDETVRELSVPPDPHVPLPEFERGDASERSGTRIEDAIERAIARVRNSRERSIVLVSDGRETDGSLRASVEHARALAIPIHVVPVRAPMPADVRIASLDLPSSVRAGAPFVVAVRVASSFDGRARVRLFRDAALNELDAVKRVIVRRGETTFSFRAVAPLAGVTRFRATVERVERTHRYASAYAEQALVATSEDETVRPWSTIEGDMGVVEIGAPADLLGPAPSIHVSRIEDARVVHASPFSRLPGGRYQARIPLGDSRGSFVARVTFVSPDARIRTATTTFTRPRVPELGDTPNLDVLRHAATVTGGRFGADDAPLHVASRSR